MGVGCCTKMDSRKQVVVQKTREEQERAFADFQLYYKTNKSFMHQKIKPIFKQVCKTGKYDSEIINLNFVNFQKARAEFLLQLIPFLQNIKVLKLWKSSLGSEGMKMISHDLGGLINLEILSLEDNSLGPDGCMHLAGALEKMKNLRELWLHINDIGMIGASCIADAVTGLKDLERLGMDENSMENKGALKVVTSVKDLKNLKMLGLGYNMLTEDACLNIVVLLGTLPLEKLILSGNNINEEIHSRMISLLPRTLIIF
ncbi:hypothetical protein SteCoe_20947 [Stentor coeruleus]|uniref:Uncharacterized protein n=1 Tax=Stentor coeruleus TaxID=5963 RepID=A0A1R2BQN8_9CILI|nr:hypothetical protein SteCoe_20947 [Stentor coeruleus]